MMEKGLVNQLLGVGGDHKSWFFILIYLVLCLSLTLQTKWMAISKKSRIILPKIMNKKNKKHTIIYNLCEVTSNVGMDNLVLFSLIYYKSSIFFIWIKFLSKTIFIFYANKIESNLDILFHI